MSSTELYRQARDLMDSGIVTDVSRVADNCGEPTLVRVDLADGCYVIAGVELDEGDPVEGFRVDGYSWTAYTSDGEVLNTDGGTDPNRFRDDLMALAAL